LRPGWKKSWPLASSLALCLLAGGHLAAQSSGAAPTNELTLAGLRPGRDTLGAAEKRFGTKHRDAQPQSGDIKEWVDSCSGRVLRLEVDDDGVIQSVTVSSLGARDPDCTERIAADGLLSVEKLRTSRGLALGQTKKRVVALYGEPGSQVPATFEDREFELLFYAFDWVGSDVPQVMEVTCERGTGRVRKITLAFPSL
jgi:hypothetical protein